MGWPSSAVTLSALGLLIHVAYLLAETSMTSVSARGHLVQPARNSDLKTTDYQA